MKPYISQRVLSLETLRSNVGVEPRQQLNLAMDLARHSENIEVLSWIGLPNYQQLEFLCAVIWDYFVQGGMIGGVTSGRQLAFKVNQLRSNTLRQLIQFELASLDCSTMLLKESLILFDNGRNSVSVDWQWL